MANTNDDFLLNLMQNVSDQLDDISNKINQDKGSKIEEDFILKISENQESIMKVSESINSNQQIIANQIENVKQDLEIKIGGTKPVVNNHEKKEYVLFGKDTPFTSKFLLLLIAIIMISSYGFKYIPDYLNEKSELKSERDSYKMFYEYAYLDAFADNNKIPNNLIDLINKIKTRDAEFIKNFNDLHQEYSNEMRKQELENQLNQLNQ